MAQVGRRVDIVQDKPLGHPRWLNDYIAPGPVGSVGDVVLQPRLKRSMPNSPFEFDKAFSHVKEPYFGSNVSNGQHVGYCSRGGPALLLDSNWNMGRGFKNRVGWYYQDLRAPDKRVEPLLGTAPEYSWHNRLATVYREKHSGDHFLPLPGPYVLSPGEAARGGRYPITTDIVGGEMPALGGQGQYGQKNTADIPDSNQLFQSAQARGIGTGRTAPGGPRYQRGSADHLSQPARAGPATANQLRLR